LDYIISTEQNSVALKKIGGSSLRKVPGDVGSLGQLEIDQKPVLKNIWDSVKAKIQMSVSCHDYFTTQRH
jgi:hypothetical protein